MWKDLWRGRKFGETQGDRAFKHKEVCMQLLRICLLPEPQLAKTHKDNAHGAFATTGSG